MKRKVISITIIIMLLISVFPAVALAESGIDIQEEIATALPDVPDAAVAELQDEPAAQEQTDEYITAIEDFFKQHGEASDLAKLEGLAFDKETYIDLYGKYSRVYSNANFTIHLDRDTKAIAMIYSISRVPIFDHGVKDPKAFIELLDPTFFEQDYIEQKDVSKNGTVYRYLIKLGDTHLTGRIAGCDTDADGNILVVNVSLSEYEEPYEIPKPLDPPKNVKAVSIDYNTVKLTWSKVEGIYYYKIEMATKKDGDYATIPSGGYTKGDGELYLRQPTGQTRYYRIRPVDVNAQHYVPENPPSEPVAATAVTAAPTNLKARRIDDKNTLTWKKTKGTNGYFIYRSATKSGGYKKIATITSKQTQRYVDSRIAKGKKYYYKVIPYRQLKAKNVRGKTAGPVYA